MIQHNGDIEKCQRASTYDRHPFIEWVFRDPIPSGKQHATDLHIIFSMVMR